MMIYLLFAGINNWTLASGVLNGLANLLSFIYGARFVSNANSFFCF